MLTYTLQLRYKLKYSESRYTKKCGTIADSPLASSQFNGSYGGTFHDHFPIMKRPGVDDFLTEMSKYYEIVVYTASAQVYADNVLDQLDTNRVIRSRLYGPSCVGCGWGIPNADKFTVKDLSLLGRALSQTIFVDDNPETYSFQPDNAIDITWFREKNEYATNQDLEQIAAFLKGIKDVPDVRGILKNWRDWPNTTSATESKTQG
jgi:carboxy-terminal domain RNA polymerase II polypeptide A small phosphatase